MQTISVKKTVNKCRYENIINVCVVCGRKYHPLHGSATTSRYCSKECYVIKMVKKIDFKITESGCFEVTSHCTNKKRGGYPIFKMDGKKKRVHRHIWEQCFGEIPNGMCVLHHCDNPLCINPEHLFLGTQKDNDNDRDKKNRQAKGEMFPLSKLTEEKVRMIRKSTKSNAELAKILNVDDSQVSRVRSGERWKHVDIIFDDDDGQVQ